VPSRSYAPVTVSGPTVYRFFSASIESRRELKCIPRRNRCKIPEKPHALSIRMKRKIEAILAAF
jgi:hypothetical protein